MRPSTPPHSTLRPTPDEETPAPEAPTPDHRTAPDTRQAPPDRWRRDVASSVVVFLIAVPLSLGIALATGAPLQAGLVAAAVGGIVAGLLNGVPLQVSGPAAGLTVITADLIQTYGWRTTCAITVVAGATQLILGALRVARAALAVSPSIVHGMLAGIGVTVALAQLHVVLGGRPESSAGANLLALPGQLVDQHSAATAIGAVTVTLLLVWPRLPGRTGDRLRQVPAALVAVAASTAMAWCLDLRVPRVDLPSWSNHALPELPRGPVAGIATAVLTMTLVASVESLLSAVAIDRLRHGARANLDRELLAQGAGNVVSGGLGGLPITGVAVRGTANVRSGAATRASTVLHGCWVVLCVGLCASLLELIPLAALAALVMVIGIQMVNFTHIRPLRRHGEVPVYLVTAAGVTFGGVLEGVGIGIAAAMVTALRRLARLRITVTEQGSEHRVSVRGQLTFLGVPRLSGVLGRIPDGGLVHIELDGCFTDHAATDTLQAWRSGYEGRGGRVTVTEHDTGRAPAETPEAARPVHAWLPWRIPRGRRHPAPPGDELLGGLRTFQRDTAPRVRSELARLAREGQQPAHLFLTCADSRMVTSMITSSGPGDLFTVRNVGNLVPRTRASSPGRDLTDDNLTDDNHVGGDLVGADLVGGDRGSGDLTGDDSVAAAIEYAVEQLRVGTITVCGHSGCGAMQALLAAPADPAGSAGARTPLARWLRHARPSLERMRASGEAQPSLADRPVADRVEQLCLTNVVQQLSHLAEHPSVAARLREGTLRLVGMYFDFSAAQAYVLDPGGLSFAPVGDRTGEPAGCGVGGRSAAPRPTGLNH